MINDKQRDHFEELRLQIFNKDRWNNSKFKVFTYEAGLGKSRNVQEYLAQVNDKALYVQRFSKEGALEDTSKRINLIAGREKAIAFSSNDSGTTKREIQACNAEVLCITHQMYISICKGNHGNLISGRKILIIDEYPDLLERVNLRSCDIGHLWSEFYEYGYKETDELAYQLRQTLNKLSNSANNVNKKEMVYLKIANLEKYTKIIGEIMEVIDRTGTKNQKDLLFKVNQLLKTGCYFYEGEFQTFDTRNKFKLLDCNIILDANENDFRYTLSNKFELINQPKVLDYSKAHFYHFDIDTSKKALKEYINLTEKVLENINFSKCKGILFVTEKAQEDAIKKAIESYFDDEINAIECHLGIPISVDYFGNLIGKNTYRNYDTVVILKTPNFDYGTYAITNLFYKYHKNMYASNIELFRDEEVEQIRNSMVAGEIYQAVRRIARHTLEGSKIYVLNNNVKVVDMVLQQLPNINYEKLTLEVNRLGEKKRKAKKSNDKLTKTDDRVEDIKKILIELKNKGITSISKQDIRTQVGVSQSSNFTSYINRLKMFFEENNIINERNTLILNKG